MCGHCENVRLNVNFDASSAVGAVSIGDHLYVCGGFDGVSSLNTVERFDPDGKKWTMVANMLKHRSAAGS